MDKHLHVGVTAPNLYALMHAVSTARYPGDRGTPTVDGDGWECWGEPLGEDVNDAETLHVIIPVRSAGAGATLARTLGATGVLVRMQDPHQRGIWASVTKAAEWSDERWCAGRNEPHDHTSEKG